MGVAQAVTAVLLITSVAFWVVMLGGVGALDADCPFPGCDKALDFVWWTVFLELFVIVTMVFAAFVPMVLHRFGGFMSAIVAIATVLLMLLNDTLNVRSPPEAGRAAMAGSVTLSITNLIYLFLMNDRDGALLPVLRGGAAPATRSAPAAHSPPVSVVQSTEFRGSKAGGDVESSLPPPNLPMYAPPAAPGAPHVVS